MTPENINKIKSCAAECRVSASRALQLRVGLFMILVTGSPIAQHSRPELRLVWVQLWHDKLKSHEQRVKHYGTAAMSLRQG